MTKETRPDLERDMWESLIMKSLEIVYEVLKSQEKRIQALEKITDSIPKKRYYDN